MGTNGSRRLICAVGAGLLLLGGLVFWVVWRLEAQVMEEALRSQVESFESHWQGVVDRYATAAFSSADGDLDSFGQKLMTAAESNPAILDVFVVTPGGEVVHQYSRQGRKTLDCLAKVPREVYVNHEHPGRIGCLNLPIKFGGTHRGSVLVHTLRDWFDEGRRAGRTVKRTAIRLAPIFLAFYVLLGGMLVVAGRTTRRWRMRAASAERVEALGAIADGINHEIRNPLNAVSLSLQLLSRKDSDAETRRVVDEAQRQTRRIGETIDEFVRFTRVSRLETERVSLADLVRPLARVKGDVVAVVDPRKLREAIEAMLGLFDTPARVTLDPGGSDWKLTATGSAADLDAARVEQLFDPYLRRRPRDIGRGLAFARAVFQAHGGNLTAQLKGATLTLRGTAPKAVQRGSKT